jgi:hypothetical protein
METGRMALNADGACTVRVGNLIVLGTAVSSMTHHHTSNLAIEASNENVDISSIKDEIIPLEQNCK